MPCVALMLLSCPVHMQMSNIGGSSAPAPLSKRAIPKGLNPEDDVTNMKVNRRSCAVVSAGRSAVIFNN